MNEKKTIAALLAVLQAFDAAWGRAVDRDEPINGSDAVEFIGGYLHDVRAAIKLAKGNK